VAHERELFRRMAERNSIHWNSRGLLLNSGLTSVCKVDMGRGDATEAPDFLLMLGEKVLDILEDAGAFKMDKQVCLIGVPTAGVALAQAASDIHYRRTGTAELVFRMLRPFVSIDPDDHRRRLWTHDDPSPEQQYWILENVCSTAGNLLSAISRLSEHGYAIEQLSVLALTERELNGRQRLQEWGIPEDRIAIGWKITELVGTMQSFGFMPDLPENAVAILQGEIDEFHSNRPF